ncbi:hypothetical protein L3Y34_019388 [Caenorhabditis briggsae]|uniref:Uncharacterized protein n=2 Tax=Caenorhabditis briggsae TaxID=6238 RepID=A0AAE9IW21_CAEBR|nr:hypothetical protein L3Y34_019388 [Caenorhabditis briggsae]
MYSFQVSIPSNSEMYSSYMDAKIMEDINDNYKFAMITPPTEVVYTSDLISRAWECACKFDKNDAVPEPIIQTFNGSTIDRPIRSKPKVIIAKLMGPIRPQPPTKQPYASSPSPEPLFRPIAPRGPMPEASKPVGPPTPPPLQIPAFKLSDPEKLQQAIEYCNNCALYKDEKLINRSQFLFDPTKSEHYQQVTKSRNSTGKNFFVAWMDREKKGTFKYTDWKNVPEDGPLKREWKQRALALEEVQEEQQRNGWIVCHKLFR